MKKWFLLAGAEVVIVAVPYGIDPAWATDNWLLLAMVGFILILIGIAAGDKKLTDIFASDAGADEQELDDWLPPEVAGRILYDYLASGDPSSQAASGMIDSFTEEMESGFPSSIMPWLTDGVDRGLISLRGRRELGSETVQVPYPLQDHWTSQAQFQPAAEVQVGADGVKYVDLEFQRSGIISYIKYLKDEYDKPQKRPHEG